MKEIDKLDSKKVINWIAGIAKQGKSRIITVPKKYWKNKIVDENKTYHVYLVEIDKEKEEEI